MKAIIVYASKHGCARRTAERLQSLLGPGTAIADALHANLPSLADYDTVILGGSIYYGKIQRQLTEFIRREQSCLADKRIGLFICAGEAEDKARLELLHSFPRELYLRALAADVLGNEIRFEKLSLMEKLIIRAVSGTKTDTGSLYGERIEHFAAQMSGQST